MARELAERAQELCERGEPVDGAIEELLNLSGRDRLQLSAGFALAVRDGGGQVTPAATLLEIARYESEGPLRAALNDPDRLLGRLVSLHARSTVWGVHWAVALLAVVTVAADDSFAVGPTLLLVAFVVGRAGFLLYAGRRLDLGRMPRLDERSGAVEQLAQLVAWRAVELARGELDGVEVEMLRELSVGDVDTPLTRRRARWVLRMAARNLSLVPGVGGIRSARHLVKAARRNVAQNLASR